IATDTISAINDTIHVKSPTKFEEIKLSQLQELLESDTILVADDEGNLGYILRDSIAPKLKIGYGLSIVNDTLISGQIKDTLFNEQLNLKYNFYPDSLSMGIKHFNMEGAGLETFSIISDMGYY